MYRWDIIFVYKESVNKNLISEYNKQYWAKGRWLRLVSEVLSLFIKQYCYRSFKIQFWETEFHYCITYSYFVTLRLMRDTERLLCRKMIKIN